MAETCANTLWFEGKNEDIRQFVYDIKLHSEQIGNHFAKLEIDAEKERLGLGDILSAAPWKDTVFLSAPVAESQPPEITWDSRRYPSILTVIKLSTLYPSIRFILRYEGTGGPIRGKYTCQNGSLLEGK